MGALRVFCCKQQVNDEILTLTTGPTLETVTDAEKDSAHATNSNLLRVTKVEAIKIESHKHNEMDEEDDRPSRVKNSPQVFKEMEVVKMCSLLAIQKQKNRICNPCILCR